MSWAEPGLEQAARGQPDSCSRFGPGETRTVTERTGGQIHGRTDLLRLGIHGLSTAQGTRLDYQSGLYPDAGFSQVPATNDPRQPDVANRLYLPQGHRLGLVLSIHRSG